MKFIIPFLIAALPVAVFAQSQSGQAPGASGVPLPKTTGVMVILTPKQAVTRQQIMAVMPSEIRETMKLYLDGKIRQWYSRGDGKGVIFLIDAKTQDEAALVLLALFAGPIWRLQQGLHLQCCNRAAVNDEPFHGSILWNVRQRAMRQARAFKIW